MAAKISFKRVWKNTVWNIAPKAVPLVVPSVMKSIFRMYHWTPVSATLTRYSSDIAVVTMMLCEVFLVTINCSKMSYVAFA